MLTPDKQRAYVLDLIQSGRVLSCNWLCIHRPAVSFRLMLGPFQPPTSQESVKRARDGVRRSGRRRSPSGAPGVRYGAMGQSPEHGSAAKSPKLNKFYKKKSFGSNSYN